MEDSNVRKRPNPDSDESEYEIDSPEVKRLRENLLESLDDDSEFCTASQDLDSFMKSFEEEIIASPAVSAAAEEVQVVDLTSDSGESRPDLGYLLEASDDELGLPPTGLESDIRSELVRVESDSSDFGNEFWEIPSYDPFGFGFGGDTETKEGDGEFVALDGLFDYSDLYFGPGEFSWRPESLPAQ